MSSLWVVLRQVLLTATAALMPLAAQAKCSAVPILSEVTDLVTALERARTISDAARIGRDIRPLQELLSRRRLTERLAEFGMGRHVNPMVAFGAQAGTLAGFAADGKQAEFRGYIASASFQRGLGDARAVVQQLCDTEGGSDPSDLASRRISTSQGTGVNAVFNSFALQAALGTSGAVLLAAGGLFVLRNRRLQRDARIAKRMACDIPVYVTQGAHTQRARVVDISRAGVNVTSEESWPPDTEVLISFAALKCNTVIRWSSAEYAGAKFLSILSARQLRDLLTYECQLPVPEKKKRDTILGAA